VSTETGVAAIDRDRPDCIINTAAMHDLNACEEKPVQAWKVNVAMPLLMAARRIDAAYVYISTDYVFDGITYLNYENYACHPLSIYGHTKLGGELAALSMIERAGICRVSYLFGKTGCRAKGGGNFVEFIVGALREGKSLALDDDTCFSPTYARDAAQQILRVAELVTRGDARGIFHCANSGVCTHFEFGMAIAELLNIAPHFVPRRGGANLLRPQNSALINTRLPTAPHWRDALKKYCEEKGYVK